MGINTEQENISKIITFLRFPLIVMVVFIHAHFGNVIVNGKNILENNSGKIYDYLSCYISDIICAIAVPMFFLISGYLFFNNRHLNFNSLNRGGYGYKLKRRVKTLFVPYIIWNALVILLFYLAQTFFPEMLSGSNKLIKDFSLYDYIWAFWDTSKIQHGMQPYPICFQFWFLRDLMVMSLLAYIVHFIVTKIPYLLLIPGVLWFVGYQGIMPGLSYSAIFFFSCGAYISLRINLKQVKRVRFIFINLVTYFLVSILALILYSTDFFSAARALSIMSGIILLVQISPYIIKRLNWDNIISLSHSSFFIYAYHGIPLTIIIRLIIKFLNPSTNISLIFIYVVSPILVIICGYYIYKFTHRFLPRFTNLITGR